MLTIAICFSNLPAVRSLLLLQFFEMPRHEAVKALDVYKRAGQQVKICNNFGLTYELIIFIDCISSISY